jgi:hypothetical protein
MAPANGSDAERLMAQIEAFLRTGEAPPAAPEPELARRSPLPPTRPYEPGGLDPLDSASVWTRRPSFWIRVRNRGGWLRSWREHLWRRRRPGLGRALPQSSRGAPRAASEGAWPWGGADRPVPQWTPLRAVLVVGGLAALLILPVIWTGQVSHTGADGTDRASTAPAGPGYSFLKVNPSGAPVRWDPCTPIHYQLDLASAPAWAATDVGHALAAISAATGIDFVYDGPTSRFPTAPLTGTASLESPVEIAWASKAQSQALHLPVDLSATGGSFPGRADTLAQTVPYTANDPRTGYMVYVSGTVLLGAAAPGLPAGFGAGGDGVLLLHQLGRLVGLGDVEDAHEVMNPAVLNTSVTALGPGDRSGLQRLGRDSGCLSVPPHASIQPAL